MINLIMDVVMATLMCATLRHSYRTRKGMKAPYHKWIVNTISDGKPVRTDEKYRGNTSSWRTINNNIVVALQRQGHKDVNVGYVSLDDEGFMDKLMDLQTVAQDRCKIINASLTD